MIKAGIFDVGGVLHDESQENILNDVSTTLQIDRETLEAAWQELSHLLGTGKIIEAEFWERFMSAANIQVPLPSESLLLRTFTQHYGLHEDVVALVKKLRQHGYALAVLSNTVLPHAQYQYKIGLYQNFDVIVLSHEVGLVKPDPAIFHHTLEKLSVTPAESFFVDDKERNIAAAKKIGIHGILYQGLEALMSDLKNLGVNI